MNPSWRNRSKTLQVSLMCWTVYAQTLRDAPFFASFPGARLSSPALSLDSTEEIQACRVKLLKDLYACLRFDFLHRGHDLGTQSLQRRSASGAFHWSSGNLCLESRLWQAEQNLDCEHLMQLRPFSIWFHRVAGNSLSALISFHSLHLRIFGFDIAHGAWLRIAAQHAKRLTGSGTSTSASLTLRQQWKIGNQTLLSAAMRMHVCR